MIDDALPLRAEEHDAWLALVLAGGAIAPRQRLIAVHRSAAAARAAGPAAWLAAGCDEAQRAALARPAPDALQQARRWLAAPGHHLIGWDDPRYPPLLRESPQPPLALFVDGEPALLAHPGVAIVGSRRPTAGGRDHAGEFAALLARAGLAVVSGLAAGIDAAAHEAALAQAQGLTVAVLGTGPDRPYPTRHAALQARIAGAGAVVSEYPPGTAARAGQFPARNRIVAGLTLGTLVVEAAHRSGALITARLAGEAGREVFAVPGSIHNPMARGCHRLIRDGAVLVESAEEVLAVLGPLAAAHLAPLRGLSAAPIESPGRDTGPPPRPANPDYQRLWQALGHDPIPMDSLVQRTGLTAAALSSMLLAMELEGRVVVRHGRYMRYP
ncbi:DNA-processing protein DprA [Stenotrophomonas sp. HITSZ_GD]|uniref:DNA-processing protein DprA n=1 Tax=Stenotrophomonas sp. HITSZ_GD TaxID=3037248 RepID=UPI00240D18A2|nr:DNA-processing protein DprA [Stenotrophomonas sp. HITSZ_GD]MDG2525124.1 DNA-processing protein DprA [Stenotrophomonas sp. HITSZ_GD]